MTAAERKALIEQKLAEARAKIAAGLVGVAVAIDPTVTIPPAPADPTTPDTEETK